MSRAASLLLSLFFGFLLGLAFMNLFHLHTLDNLYRIQAQLSNELMDREIKLTRLTENMEKQRVILIKDINIAVAYEGNQLTKDKIEKSVQFFLAELVGKELSMVDGEMLYKILDERIIEVEDKRIQLDIKYILLSERISISLMAKTLE